MSRPPRPESARPLRGQLAPREGRLDYLPLDFGGLVDLATQLGGAAPDVRDPTATLYELSALVAHVLGVHQDHIASEAFLGTACTARSLVKHGRRLGYEPAPGSTATGYLSVEVKLGLEGELPVGLVAASTPAGGVPAQDFETRVARKVSAAWNRLEVRASDRQQVIDIPASTTTLRLKGKGLGLRAGEPAILTGPAHWLRIGIASVAEQGPDTWLTLDAPLGVALGAADDPSGYTLWSRPSIELRLLGWNSDPALFPPDRLEAATTYTAPTVFSSSTPASHGYQVSSSEGVATSAVGELFLERTLSERVLGQFLLVSKPSGAEVIQVGAAVTEQVDAAVRFVRGGARQIVMGVNPSTGAVTFGWVLDERALASTVTRLRAHSRAGTARRREDIGVHGRLSGNFRVTAQLLSREPARALSLPDQDLFVEGAHPGLEPGMLLALATRDLGLAQVVELTEREVQGTNTRLRYKERSARPANPDGTPHRWELGDLVVLGNVVPLAHGTARQEVLGESDGVTPFQRYKLKKAPLAHLPSGGGVDPELEVRVGGVRWDRVTDFGVPRPDPTARHYKLERDHDGSTWVRFGDGQTGAVPPAGRSNLSASYRVGLGSLGNLDAGRLTRLLKGHPLVERVRNPVATAGGTAPAAAEDVRRQATRHIRTFDRAVSVRDHADLALLFPGVARATARLAAGNIELVAAAADGGPVPNQELLLEFLDARRDGALRLVPVEPEAVSIQVRLYVEIEDAFLIRDVEASVRDALFGSDPAAPGLFTFAARDLGQAAHPSELHARLAQVPGARFVQLLWFDLAPGTGLRDVLQPRAYQWLRLEASGLSFAPPEEGDHD